MIRFIAETQPQWSIVLIGPIQTDVSRIKDLKNVFLLGKKDFLSLPSYINEFDVCIIPYENSKYTTTVFPTKLNEYHAMGKVAVSTDLPEVANFNAENDNLVLVGKTHEQFVTNILNALKNNSKELSNQRIASAKINSWTARFEKMDYLLMQELERKTSGPANWQERFIKFYKSARRKTIRLTSIVLGIYILLFYTPLFWFIASPLKISQEPEKSDCIVVFAGGVGELGKAGQGYEERVDRGVRLYKYGYANNLIFVSGFSYFYKEPYIMETLAVSLGIPKKAISLEERGANTFEYVRFLKQRSSENNWRKVLLVSSPYHMRRASLVFKKIAPEIKVIFTPVTQSAFYAHDGYDNRGARILRQINLQQIKAIIHEYISIAYYYFKGYL